MRSVIAVSLLLAAVATAPAAAAECPGNPDAIGVSRVLVDDPTEHPLLGALGYKESLPLNDHEVVLTFDDGPLPPYTSRILDILRHECVKATFFMVGRMARAYPKMVKRVFEEGHTIANHSESHPFTFRTMSVEHAAQEIQGGFNSIRTALGDPNGVAPFFRFPGLLHQPAVERYLKEQGVQAWSVDVVADDWTHINSHEIVRRAMDRLEAKRKGILLLHDIQPATALGLADLLHELKAHGFKIVQVVPAGPGRPKTPTTPDQWILHHHHEAPSIWPEPAVAGLVPSAPELETPSPQSFGVTDTPGALVPVALNEEHGAEATMPMALWPHAVPVKVDTATEVLPAPAAETFRYSRVWRPNLPKRTARHLGSHKPSARKTASHKAMHADSGAEDITYSISPSAKRTASASTGTSSRTGGKDKRQRTARVRQAGHQIELPQTAPAAPPAAPPPPAKKLGGLLDLFR